MALEFSVAVNGKPYSSIESAGNAIGAHLSRAVDEGMQQVSVELQKALTKLYEEMEAKHGSQWPLGGDFGTDPERLAVRSGKGLRTIKESIRVDFDGVTVSGSISAGDLSVHETGATVRATNAKYLTIPLPAALDSRGLPLRERARDWDSTFVARSKRGNLIIFRKNTGGTITPLYILKTQVTIPPRLGLGKAFNDMVPYFQAKAIDVLEKRLNAPW